MNKLLPLILLLSIQTPAFCQVSNDSPNIVEFRHALQKLRADYSKDFLNATVVATSLTAEEKDFITNNAMSSMKTRNDFDILSEADDFFWGALNNVIKDVGGVTEFMDSF